MLDETTREALLEKAEAPGRDAIRLHGFYQGKIETWPKAAIAAAYELADYAADPANGGLRTDHILPTTDERGVVPRVAAAVGRKAIEQGLAGRDLTRDELIALAQDRIGRAGAVTEMLMRSGFIAPCPTRRIRRSG